jgi:TetR/AcrR family transcriptional regulator, transcriptional repressor for nem operon
MSRTKPPQQRRADLLAAGQAMFLARGIAATSLDDITARAGVSKGLFYLYFGSKEDLVFALQEQFAREYAGRILAAADRQADWGGKLDACVQAGFEYYRELHDLHEVLFHRAGPGASRGHEPAYGMVTKVIAELFAAGVAAGAFDVADPEAAAVLCQASMHAFDNGVRDSAGPDDARLMIAAQQLFRRVAGAARS